MKIAIQANPSRGKEIISLLKSLGGGDTFLNGNGKSYTYYIGENNMIRYNDAPKDYKVYTLEEFEKEFPFKIGDKVRDCSDNEIGTILGFIDIDGELMYIVDFEKSGHTNMPVEELKPYKEMEKRNITLTLDKAKEWYKKGGELKEIALQAFTEKELKSLPRSWEEFCKNYHVQKGECWLSDGDEIEQTLNLQARNYKNWIPSMKSAEAHLAMIQLEQLRDCWRQGWEPEYNEHHKYGIRNLKGELTVIVVTNIASFLTFPTREMAKEFLKCFRDLIEQAGDLI